MHVAAAVRLAVTFRGFCGAETSLSARRANGVAAAAGDLGGLDAAPSYFRSSRKETLALTRKFLTLSFSTVAWNSLM